MNVGTDGLGPRLGSELRIGMPVAQLLEVMNGLRGVEIVDGSSVIWLLRMIKSEAEVVRIKKSIDVAGAVYDAVPDFGKIGDTEVTIQREFRARLNSGGAGNMPIVICRSDIGGPFEISGGPRDRPIADGDLLFFSLIPARRMTATTATMTATIRLGT